MRTENSAGLLCLLSLFQWGSRPLEVPYPLTQNHRVNPKDQQVQLVLGLSFVQFLDPLFVKEYIICK